MPMRVAKRTFSGGEIDPDLWYTSDLVQVRNGAAEIRNFIVRPQGGIERTPGTEFIAKAKADGPVRLGRFVAARNAAYLVEYSDSNARIRNSDQVASVQDVATPYGDGDLPYLQWAQSNDVQWVFSGKPVKELQRTEPAPGVYSFALVDAAIRNGPFLDRNLDEALTLTASAETGAGITLTASASLFQAGHVGAYFKIEENDYSYSPKWKVGTSVVVGAVCRYNGNVYRCASAGTTSGNAPSHTEGQQADSTDAGAVVWEYLHSGYGIVKITGYTDALNVTADVVKRLPGQALGGVYKWSEGAWSDVRGYPITGALYKRALWAGGTISRPSHIWKSANDGFDDWELGVEDDSAIARGLFGEESSAVRWFSPSQYLMIGTDGPEWLARPDQSGDVARPNNLITETTTNQGSSEVPGISVGSSTVFLDASLTELRGAIYDYRNDAWAERNYSLFANHLLGRKVVQMAYQRRPWPLFWFLLSDGTVGALTFLPEQEILAWHHHDFGGFVEGISVAPMDDGQRETLFLAVRRQVAGNTELHIERMFDRFRPERGQTIEQARYLFSAKTYDEAEAGTVFAGLDHLEGQEVIALVDGKSHPPMTVADGSVTLNFPGKKVIIGLAYQSRVKMLPFDLGAQEEFQTSRNPSVQDLSIVFRASQGGEVVIGERSETVWPLGASALDRAPDLHTGPEKIEPPSSQHSQLEYRNATAWPAHVVGVFPQYEV